MSFEYVFLRPKKLIREDRKQGRHYVTEEGIAYPSVTNALSYLSRGFLETWRKNVGDQYADEESRRAAAFGKAVHNIAEKYLLNDSSWDKAMPTSLLAFKKIKPYLENNVTKIYGIELPMYSHELRVAGTADCICLYKGKLTVLDFKTSKRRKSKDDIISYYLQACAYGVMVFELYGLRIEQIVILMTVTDDIAIEFVESIESYLPMTKKYFSLYAQGKLC